MATWLVTGANRGIGLGLVERLAARGDTVFACARDPDAPALRALTSRRVERVPLDVTDPTSIAAATVTVGSGPIDVLVNNAGVIGPERQTPLEMDFDGFLATLAVNTLGPLRIAQAFLPNLWASQAPRIVTVSSTMGQMASAGASQIAYRASKAAVNKLMQGLAAELRSARITVVVMHPGWVKTDMGGRSATLPVERSTTAMIATIDRLTLADTGAFLNYDGATLAW